MFVTMPETVTGLPGLAKSGLTEVMATDTGTVPPACRAAATLAAAPLSVTPDMARTHRATKAGAAAYRARARRARAPGTPADAPKALAVAALLVSGGRGMAEMLLRVACPGERGCAHKRAEGRGAAWTVKGEWGGGRGATEERATREGGASRMPRGERDAESPA